MRKYPKPEPTELQYYIIYKPFNMLSKFQPEGKLKALKDLEYPFPKDVYPVGRLDSDSEGLLILSNDTSLNHKLLHPSHQHNRTYLAQVDGIITPEAAAELEKGVEISVEGKLYFTKPAKAELIAEPEDLPERMPPVRYRKSLPTSWLKLTLTEGKNRQVRRMTAKVGFPTLRLIRVSIENLELGTLQPGEVKELQKEEIYRLLKLR
jgi:23S rRNA pseudouridine2457 synthase